MNSKIGSTIDSVIKFEAEAGRVFVRGTSYNCQVCVPDSMLALCHICSQNMTNTDFPRHSKGVATSRPLGQQSTEL